MDHIDAEPSVLLVRHASIPDERCFGVEGMFVVGSEPDDVEGNRDVRFFNYWKNAKQFRSAHEATEWAYSHSSWVYLVFSVSQVIETVEKIDLADAVTEAAALQGSRH